MPNAMFDGCAHYNAPLLPLVALTAAPVIGADRLSSLTLFWLRVLSPVGPKSDTLNLTMN